MWGARVCIVHYVPVCVLCVYMCIMCACVYSGSQKTTSGVGSSLPST